jgi:hypothetical protein
MRYTTDTDHPFDTDNRAWRRFVDLLGEHFDVVGWTREDRRPVLTTLVDLASGDAFTHRGPRLRRGPRAARAARLHPGRGLVRTRPLRRPARSRRFRAAAGPHRRHACGHLPGDAWRPLPAEFARAARPALADSHAAVLVLLDRTGEMLAAVGPFANQAAAGRWRPHTRPRHGRGTGSSCRCTRRRHPGMTCRHPRRRP